MKPVSSFFPSLLPYVPGCPDPLAARAVVDSAISFCEDSLVISETLDSFFTEVGVSAYELSAPSDQQVCSVRNVTVGGNELTATVDGNELFATSATGTPHRFFTSRTSGELMLHVWPVPDVVAEVKVFAALRPVKDATQLDDDLYALWMAPVLAGAIAKIRAVPNQPFSDPADAMMKAAQAASMSNRARIKGSYGRMQGGMRVTQRPMA